MLEQLSHWLTDQSNDEGDAEPCLGLEELEDVESCYIGEDYNTDDGCSFGGLVGVEGDVVACYCCVQDLTGKKDRIMNRYPEDLKRMVRGVLRDYET